MVLGSLFQAKGGCHIALRGRASTRTSCPTTKEGTCTPARPAAFASTSRLSTGGYAHVTGLYELSRVDRADHAMEIHHRQACTPWLSRHGPQQAGGKCIRVRGVAVFDPLEPSTPKIHPEPEPRLAAARFRDHGGSPSRFKPLVTICKT